MRDFNRVIVFFSIMCPRYFTRVKKKCDLSEAAFIFCSVIFGDIFQNCEHFIFGL